MDDVDDVFDVIDAIEAVEGIIERAPVRRRDRQDPFELHDLEFKGRYRFSKANVQRLSTMLAPFLEKENNRGLPFTPLQIVCAGLHYLGGRSLPEGGSCLCWFFKINHTKHDIKVYNHW